MKHWYVVHTQTGLEDKVKTSLEKKVVSSGMQELVSSVVIPTEQVSEVRSGKKRISQRKIFPRISYCRDGINRKYVLADKKHSRSNGFYRVGQEADAPSADGSR